MERPGSTQTVAPEETPEGRAAKADADHVPVPAQGTLYCAVGQREARLGVRTDYPVDALCADCGDPVRVQEYGGPFRHTGRRPGDPR